MDVPAALRLRFGSFDLDEAEGRLTHDGQAVALPPKAFAVLCTLLRQPGQLVPKDALLDAVWGHRHVSESVLKSTVSELRGALADDARRPRYVETASRRGYRFIGVTSAFATAAAAAAPLPPACDIVGRDAPLARLRAAWELAASGRRQLCCLAGEAGIGKTTLIDGFAAGLGPVARADGQCVEQFGAGEPYLPVLDALAALGRSDPALPTLLRATAPTWLLQLPWLVSGDEHERLRGRLAATTQDRMLREFAELIEQYTQHRPLLLVTEDLHWCDDATVRLLDHVARRRGPARLMWVASYRSAELAAAGHPLDGVRHELRARRLCDEIALEPFTEAELALYLGRRRPQWAADADGLRRLHRQTDGLPLYVANLVGESEGPPAPAPGAAADGSEWPVPETLAGVIERQFGRLAADAAALLDAAAVCGVEFGTVVLAGALQRDPAALAAQCDALARRQQWLRPTALDRLADGTLDARYAFRHAMYRQVLYQHLPALDRVALHRQVAAAIERRRGPGAAGSAAALAMHHERGLEPLAALRAYADAAEQALGRFAPAEAVHLTGRGLALLPDCPETVARMEAELKLVHMRGAAFAQSTGIASAAADAAFERAAQLCELLPPSAQRAWVLTGLAWMLTSRGRYRDGEEIAARLQAMATRHGDPPLLAAACCAQAVALVQQGRLAEAEGLVSKAVEATADLRSTGMPTALVIDPAVASRGIGAALLAHLGRLDAVERWLAEAVARAQALGQPISRGFAMRCSCMVFARLDLPERAQPLAQQLLGLVEQHGLRIGDAPGRCLLGWAESRLGDAAAGHRRIVEGCARHREQGTMFDITLALRLAAAAALRAGDAATALRHVDEGLALADALGERLHVPDLLVCRGLVEKATGQVDAARATLRDAVGRARAMQALTAELNAQTALCEACEACEAGADRADLADLRALRQRWPDSGALPLTLRADRLLAG